MNGYSKMKMMSKPRSMDITDLLTFSPLQNPQSPKIKSHPQQIPNQIKNAAAMDSYSSEQEDEDFNTIGGRERRISTPRLSRNSSVSSAYALGSAVKRAFSMRRSSSVSERYCRIHDQSVTLSSPFDYDDEEEETEAGSGGTKKKKKKKKKKKEKKNDSRDKILKACKRLFGF